GNGDPAVTGRLGCAGCSVGDRIRILVGGPGFEPGASRSRTVRAAKLRQPPTTSNRSIFRRLETNRAPDVQRSRNSVILPAGRASDVPPRRHSPAAGGGTSRRSGPPRSHPRGNTP